jgi:hypothetical protein
MIHMCIALATDIQDIAFFLTYISTEAEASLRI